MSSDEKISPYVAAWKGKTTLSSAEFVAVFKQFDKDGNGYIDKDELDDFLRELMKEKTGDILDDEAVQQFKKVIFEKFDKNNDSKIELLELGDILPTEKDEDNLLLRIKKHRGHLNSADFMKIWKHYDKDCSGYLEKAELEGFCLDLLKKDKKKKVDMPMVNKFSKALLELYDTNKDGKLCFKELTKLLPIEENFFKQWKACQELSKEDFEKIFGHYDTDRDGTIAECELDAFVKDLMEFFKEGNVSHIKSDMKSVSRSIGLALTTIPYIFAACYWSDYAYQSYDLRQVAKWRMKFSHPVWHMIGVVWPRIRRCCKKTKVDGR